MAIADPDTISQTILDVEPADPGFRTAPYHQIVVPLDGSPAARAALGPAAELASRTGAALVLVHAVVPNGVPDGGYDTALDLAETSARVMLGRRAQPLIGAGLEVEQLLVVPRPEEPLSVPNALLTAIRTTCADLVVMTTHGRTGVERAVFGSVAEEVIRRARTPVLVIPPAAGRPPRAAQLLKDRSASPPTILVALDGSPEAESVLEPAAQLAAALGARSELLRVTPRQRLLGRGSAAAAIICARASTIGASAIALATHGRTGLSRLLKGSVAASVVSLATVPVLLVRPDQGIPGCADSGYRSDWR